MTDKEWARVHSFNFVQKGGKNMTKKETYEKKTEDYLLDRKSVV